MKKLFKALAASMVLALAFSAAACNMTDKTVTRREEYVAKAEQYVAELGQDNYSADKWQEITELLEQYAIQIGDLAAKSKMDAAYREFVAKAGAVADIEGLVDAYIEAIDGRIQEALTQVLAGLDPAKMGISNVVYNESDNSATFYICDETDLIRNFADTGICAIFQNLFTDVDYAELIVNDEGEVKNGLLTHAQLFDEAGLKHHIGEQFIKLFVEDYAYAPLSHLVGNSAQAVVYFNMDIGGGKTVTRTVTLSCSFVETIPA